MNMPIAFHMAIGNYVAHNRNNSDYIDIDGPDGRVTSVCIAEESDEYGDRTTDERIEVAKRLFYSLVICQNLDSIDLESYIQHNYPIK